MTAAAPNEDVARPTALFVLGMARSGTAALTRVLSLSGGTLPPGMAGANKANPLGFWEPRKAIQLNLEIMRLKKSTFFDPSMRLQEQGAFDPDERAKSVNDIKAYLTSFPAAPVVVIKEPSITALSGMWFEAARLAGYRVVTVIAVRHPAEVVASLGKMGAKASPELAGALWLKYNLLSERDSRGVPRVFVDYANLLGNWRGEIQRISKTLAIKLEARDEGVIDEFLTPDLRHQQHAGSVPELFGTDWFSVVYDALSAAARDEPFDADALDRVFEGYRAAEQGFRKVSEELHRFRMGRRVPPSVTKLALEVVALAHRRKGTWA